MVRIVCAAAVAAAISVTATMPAAAAVLDASYRGTLLCDKLPFTHSKMREAIAVRIAGGKVSYSHVVRLGENPESAAEQGTGSLSGQDIALEGSWKGGARQYEAKYSGTFVRRSARLKGTQTWNDNGKTVSRSCAGVIKRPLRAFLPRKKSQAAD